MHVMRNNKLIKCCHVGAADLVNVVNATKWLIWTGNVVKAINLAKVMNTVNFFIVFNAANASGDVVEIMRITP